MDKIPMKQWSLEAGFLMALGHAILHSMDFRQTELLEQAEQLRWLHQHCHSGAIAESCGSALPREIVMKVGLIDSI